MSNQLNRRPAIDPAVADIQAGAEKKKRLAGMSRFEQAKARPDAARHKVGPDLPPDLRAPLRTIANKEKISISSLVASLAQRGLEEYSAGSINLFPYKRVSRCARFEYVLGLDQKDATKMG